MSYRIITHRDYITGAERAPDGTARFTGGVERAYILDEAAGKIIAGVATLEGCKPLVELANRAAADAVEKAKKRTEAAGGATPTVVGAFGLTADRLRIAVEALEAIVAATESTRSTRDFAAAALKRLELP